MNIDTIRTLKNNSSARFRVGTFGTDNVMWGEWQTGDLHVQKRTCAINKKPFKRSYEEGAVIIVCPKTSLCEEFSEDDYDFDNDIFSGEEYIFQIDWESVTS